METYETRSEGDEIFCNRDRSQLRNVSISISAMRTAVAGNISLNVRRKVQHARRNSTAVR